MGWSRVQIFLNVILLASLPAGGCSVLLRPVDEAPDAETHPDGDGDLDEDHDPVTDGDADGDTDADGDGDTDLDTDFDLDVDQDADLDAEADREADADLADCTLGCMGRECGVNLICDDLICGNCLTTEICSDGICVCLHESCNDRCCDDGEVCSASGECCIPTGGGEGCGGGPDGCGGICPGRCPGGVCCGDICLSEGQCCTSEDCPCSGTPTDCSRLGDHETECRAQRGCSWSESCNEPSMGSRFPCSHFNPAGEAICEGCGCIWDSGGATRCTNDPARPPDCESISPSLCATCSCDSVGSCTGTAAACNGFSPEDCHLQSGCHQGTCSSVHYCLTFSDPLDG